MFNRIVAITCAAWIACAATPSLAQYPDLKTPTALQKAGANDVAIIMAVEDYATLADVKGAVANGQDWEAFFKDSLGMKAVHFVSNSQATKEELERLAKLAVSTSKRNGKVWFIFIGHGFWKRINQTTDDNDGLLVGADAEATPQGLRARGTTLQSLLDVLQTGRQAQTVLVIDAAFGGRNRSGEPLLPMQMVLPISIQPAILSTTVVLTAATTHQAASALPGADRPAFSYILLGALRGWAVDSGDVTASKAHRFVERALRGGSRDQSPGFFGDGEAVMTRGVVERDPGIRDLMDKISRASSPEIILGAPQ